MIVTKWKLISTKMLVKISHLHSNKRVRPLNVEIKSGTHQSDTSQTLKLFHYNLSALSMLVPTILRKIKFLHTLSQTFHKEIERRDGPLNEAVTLSTNIHVCQRMVLAQREHLTIPTIYLELFRAYFHTEKEVLKLIDLPPFLMKLTVDGLCDTVINIFAWTIFLSSKRLVSCRNEKSVQRQLCKCRSLLFFVTNKQSGV